MKSPGRPRVARALPLLIAAAVFAAFWPALGADFSNFDDPGVILEPPGPGYRGFTRAHLEWMFTTTHMGHYQPLTWLSYAVDHAVWGLAPRGFHLTSMLIHAVNAALVYLLAVRLFSAARPGVGEAAGPTGAMMAGAAVAALLWGAHPLRVESVAWVTERRDVLSGCFLLLAALAYLRAFAPRTVRPASAGWYAASVLLLLASLLSKAWGMTFFVVLLAIDWYPLRRLPDGPPAWFGPRGRAVLLQKLPYAVLGVVFAAQAARAQASQPFAVKTLGEWGPIDRLCQAAYGLLFYVQKLVWPSGLAPMYELPASARPNEPRFLIAIIAAAALGALAVGAARRWPGYTVAAAVYAVLLSPVLGILQSGIQLAADRYSYLANVSWSLLAGGVLASALVGALRRRLLIAALAGAAVLTLSMLTWRQTTFWRNTETLFAHAIAVGEDGPILRAAYGRQFEKERPAEALRQFELAIERDPGYGEAWFNRASALKALGRMQEAERSYQRASALMPDSWRADLMLGVLYYESEGRLADARAALESAVRKIEAPGARSGSPRAYILLAAVLDESGDERGCREMLGRAARYPETREEALGHLREMDAGR